MKPAPGNRRLWLTALRQRIVWQRVLRVGLPVGVLQAVLNQGDVWYHHQATGLTLFKTVVSPLVTSSVALVSAASTWVERQAEAGTAPEQPPMADRAGTLAAEISR